MRDGAVILSGKQWVNAEIDASEFAGGTGTQEDPYRIETQAQLRAFAGSLNEQIDYTGQYVVLNGDIALSDEPWKPIGGSDYLFNGTFDGQGHIISGMTLGTKDAPLALDSENIYIGLFGVLGPKSVVKNVRLTELSFYTTYGLNAFIGGIAGVTQGSVEEDYTGSVIDSCTVSGTIWHTGSRGNQFVGGLVGMQYKGAVINSSTQVNATCIVTSGDLAEVGGLVGLNNRGLVANCWSDSDLYGSGNRDNGNEGMAAVSNLIAVNAGTLANCYASGNVTTREHSTYAGMVTGWITGIGKSYTCWYDLDSTMLLKEGDENPQIVNPVESVGTKISSGLDDEGGAFTGGLSDKLTGYNAAGYPNLPTGLNDSFATFPADVTLWGLSENALKNWVYTDGTVTLGETFATVHYVQPECEKYVAPEPVLQDGTWYGRDDEKTTVVEIRVLDGSVTEITVLSGAESGEAYEAAVAKAKYKATYGDDSHYEPADVTRFAGGSGTAEDPYLIANAEQLRYLSDSINADVNWSGIYFKQTEDIILTGQWRPIGWNLYGDVNGGKTLICAYPFSGSFDGDNHTITGLTIGTEQNPADQFAAGLFGLTSGPYLGNEVPDGTEAVVTLKNIHLRDISIYVSTRYEVSVGGIVGYAQNGFYLDNCSVTGQIHAETSESFARAGGLMGCALRGGVTNSWADVDITAVTDTNHVYAGGLYGLDNRVTTVNCYALGNVTGNSSSNNKVHIGGLTGQGGGIHVNCYAAGNVVSLKSTSDVGILHGRATGINIDVHCYYNTEAVLKQGDTTVSPAVANGVTVSSATVVDVTGKTAAELASAEFAALLNQNLTASALEEAMKSVNTALVETTTGLVQQNYYQGNDLLGWALYDHVVTFAHIYEEIIVAPTCLTDGYTEYKCSVCGYSYRDSFVPATGHDTEYEVVAPTHDTMGYTVTRCKNCEFSSVHSFTDALGHSFTITVTKEATCTTEGEWTFTCDCGDSYTMPIPTIACPGKGFADVETDAWYHEAVDYAISSGLMNGVTTTSFAPNGETTRSMLATLLYRMAGEPDVTGLTNPFTDVPANAWYNKAVIWAYSKGIVTGATATSFNPDGELTREQLAVMLWRYADKPEADESVLNTFSDVKSVGAYAKAAMAWAVETGLINGVGNQKLEPTGSASRAQIATILMRYIQN